MTKLFSALIVIVGCAVSSISINADAATIKSKTEGMTKYKGYFEYYYDEKTDKIFLVVDNFDQEFLYVQGLAAGIGSNDIGLDRNQLGRERVVKFVKRGPKILLLQPNYDY